MFQYHILLAIASYLALFKSILDLTSMPFGFYCIKFVSLQCVPLESTKFIDLLQISSNRLQVNTDLATEAGRDMVNPKLYLFTALHVMQPRSSDENSVCPSVRLSVCHTLDP